MVRHTVTRNINCPQGGDPDTRPQRCSDIIRLKFSGKNVTLIDGDGSITISHIPNNHIITIDHNNLAVQDIETLTN